jgi:hypothetical protein
MKFITLAIVENINVCKNITNITYIAVVRIVWDLKLFLKKNNSQNSCPDTIVKACTTYLIV